MQAILGRRFAVNRTIKCESDQGIKFCSKIQSARNHFKPNESIDLVVANPMQLVWVQMDIGSERYRVLFEMTHRQKKMDVDCTVRTAAEVTVRTTRGRAEWQIFGI